MIFCATQFKFIYVFNSIDSEHLPGSVNFVGFTKEDILCFSRATMFMHKIYWNSKNEEAKRLQLQTSLPLRGTLQLKGRFYPSHFHIMLGMRYLKPYDFRIFDSRSKRSVFEGMKVKFRFMADDAKLLTQLDSAHVWFLIDLYNVIHPRRYQKPCLYNIRKEQLKLNVRFNLGLVYGVCYERNFHLQKRPEIYICTEKGIYRVNLMSLETVLMA